MFFGTVYTRALSGDKKALYAFSVWTVGAEVGKGGERRRWWSGRMKVEAKLEGVAELQVAFGGLSQHWVECHLPTLEFTLPYDHSRYICIRAWQHA
jgi:hypothetical protein